MASVRRPSYQRTSTCFEHAQQKDRHSYPNVRSQKWKPVVIIVSWFFTDRSLDPVSVVVSRSHIAMVKQNLQWPVPRYTDMPQDFKGPSFVCLARHKINDVTSLVCFLILATFLKSFPCLFLLFFVHCLRRKLWVKRKRHEYLKAFSWSSRNSLLVRLSITFQVTRCICFLDSLSLFCENTRQKLTKATIHENASSETVIVFLL